MVLYVMGWPQEFGVPIDDPEAYVVPILQRSTGVLIAVALDFVPRTLLDQGNQGTTDGLVGPSTEVSIQAMEEDDQGAEQALDVNLNMLLVDFSPDVLPYLSEYGPAHKTQRTSGLSCQVPLRCCHCRVPFWRRHINGFWGRLQKDSTSSLRKRTLSPWSSTRNYQILLRSSLPRRSDRRLYLPSRHLPSGWHLACLEAVPSLQTIVVCVSDRQDYYHQLRVSPERAASNTLWPPLPAHLLHSTRAFDVLADSLASERARRGDW